jgi:hypothetical protein
MSSPRSLPAGAVLFLFAVLMGCATAGPDLNGPDGPNIMAAYSGDWVLVPSESVDLNTKMTDSMRGPAGGPGGGGMAGGRGGGGGGGGGRGGASGGGSMRGGMPGSGMDPEEMRQSMEVIRGLAQVPGEIHLNLRPEVVTFTQDAANVLILTLGASKESVLQAGTTLLGTAKWTKDGIEINREMEMGGGVKDEISLNEEGNLVLKREIDLMGRTVKGTMVFQRKSNGG